LKEALDLLKELVLASKKGEFITQFESLDNTYENLLKYAIEGVQDTERGKIYNRLLVSVLELADVAYHYTFTNESDLHIYQLKKKLEYGSRQITDEAFDNVENLVFVDELAKIINTRLDLGLNDREEYYSHQNLISKIFNLLWLTDKFKEPEVKIVQTIFQSDIFPWYEKSIIISAITISVIRCFDKNKTSLLIDFSGDGNDQVRQRALVGLFLVMFLYDKRINLYPELLAKIETLAEQTDLEGNFEFIAIQLIRSKETEKITKKLEEEILPEMVKYQPVIRDKLDLDNILPSDFSEDKNPDWERVFEDAPDLLDKLQEISKLQMEGTDVFMSAFSRLKNFDFFNEIINWFRPFHKDNFLLIEILEKEKFDIELFLDGLTQSPFMCNSDKYSFCLNVKYMPDLQKNMLMSMFNADLESLKELQQEDDILNKPSRVKSMYSQYIQDLYRFFKLYPLKKEFTDIFALKFSFHQCRLIVSTFKNKNVLRNLAEYYFEKDHFEEAGEIYIQLNNDGDNSLEIYEKIGYCFQKLKKYNEALNYYKKAELYDSNRGWNLKKLALCHRYLKNYQESLKYYLEAEKLEPDNLFIQTYIGHSYLDLKEYEKALNYYFKVEFLASENKKVLRPIAWCTFVLGNFETSRKYYQMLIESETDKYDFINLGHVEWCMGNKKTALKNYKLSINRDDNNLKSFLTSFEEDRLILEKHGIDQEEITYMIDYLKYVL
jgi:tetratricopeptide (TPR) repeat protein